MRNRSYIGLLLALFTWRALAHGPTPNDSGECGNFVELNATGDLLAFANASFRQIKADGILLLQRWYDVIGETIDRLERHANTPAEETLGLIRDMAVAYVRRERDPNLRGDLTAQHLVTILRGTIARGDLIAAAATIEKSEFPTLSSFIFALRFQEIQLDLVLPRGLNRIPSYPMGKEDSRLGNASKTVQTLSEFGINAIARHGNMFLNGGRPWLEFWGDKNNSMPEEEDFEIKAAQWLSLEGETFLGVGVGGVAAVIDPRIAHREAQEDTPLNPDFLTFIKSKTGPIRYRVREVKTGVGTHPALINSTKQIRSAMIRLLLIDPSITFDMTQVISASTPSVLEYLSEAGTLIEGTTDLYRRANHGGPEEFLRHIYCAGTYYPFTIRLIAP